MQFIRRLRTGTKQSDQPNPLLSWSLPPRASNTRAFGSFRYSIEFMFLLSSSTRAPTGDKNKAMDELLQYRPLKNRMLVFAELDGFGGSMLAVLTSRFSRYTLSFERETILDYSCSIARNCHFLGSIEHRYMPLELACGSV